MYFLTHTHTRTHAVLNISHHWSSAALSSLRLCGTEVIILDITQQHLTCCELVLVSCDGKTRTSGWMDGENKVVR